MKIDVYMRNCNAIDGEPEDRAGEILQKVCILLGHEGVTEALR